MQCVISILHTQLCSIKQLVYCRLMHPHSHQSPKLHYDTHALTQLCSVAVCGSVGDAVPDSCCLGTWLAAPLSWSGVITNHWTTKGKVPLIDSYKCIHWWAMRNPSSDFPQNPWLPLWNCHSYRSNNQLPPGIVVSHPALLLQYMQPFYPPLFQVDSN